MFFQRKLGVVVLVVINVAKINQQVNTNCKRSQEHLWHEWWLKYYLDRQTFYVVLSTPVTSYCSCTVARTSGKSSVRSAGRKSSIRFISETSNLGLCKDHGIIITSTSRTTSRTRVCQFLQGRVGNELPTRTVEFTLPETAATVAPVFKLAASMRSAANTIACRGLGYSITWGTIWMKCDGVGSDCDPSRIGRCL